MFNKPFFLVFFVLIICQVLFSFYYSSEIINQNNLINKNQISLESLKIENQELNKNLSASLSLNQIQNKIDQDNSYINLKTVLNLQN